MSVTPDRVADEPACRADAAEQRRRPPSVSGRTVPLLCGVVIASFLALAWAGPITARLVGDEDFPNHLAWAQEFAADGRITMPHFLLQVTLGALYATGLFRTISDAALLYFYVVHVLGAIAVFWFVNGAERRPAGVAVSVVLTVAVLIAAPVLPPGFADDVYLIGYFPPNVYHNPTSILAKPLLVPFFAAGLASLVCATRPRGAELAASAVVAILLGLAKPNYLGCLIPALSVAVAWRLWRKSPVSVMRAVVLIGAAVATLFGSIVLYQSEELQFRGSDITVAPFAVIAIYSPADPVTLTLKLAASVLFPLVVVAAWPKEAWQSTMLRLAWGACAIGVLISYLLAETGTRMDHGAFLWSGQMGVFVLFAASAAFLRERVPRVARRRALTWGIVILATLALHVESGIRHARVKVAPRAWTAWWQTA